MRSYKTIMLIAIVVIFVTALAIPALAKWSVVDAYWRTDENPWAKKQVWEGYYWTEGWSNREQFYPKYFKPAGSMHVILKNDSETAKSVDVASIDGSKLDDIMTTRTVPGRVIWHNVFPREVKPGGWAEVIVRLRSKPEQDLKLGLMSGQENFDIMVPIQPVKTRIESVSFSTSADKLYVYIRNLDGSRPKPRSISIDWTNTKAAFTPGPAGSALVLAEVPLPSPLEWGTYHLLQVHLADGKTLTHPVRAWGNYFAIAMFGTVEQARIKDCVDHGFNTYVGVSPDPLLDEQGVNCIPLTADAGRQRTLTQSGNLFYYNWDEPDGFDATSDNELPYMDRLGYHAQTTVIPIYWNQYQKDPKVPALLMIDGTYKPLNYYVYGQLCDVFCSDPYVPLGGNQVDYVARVLEAAGDASTPHPLLAILWATTEGRDDEGPTQRPATPVEERMMAYYAMASGIKGLMYFADWDHPGGSNMMGVSHNKRLWEEIGRINADVKALSPYLSVGCPSGASREDEKVWTRSLMCGRDSMVLVVINKGHYIGYTTKYGFAWHDTAKDVKVSTALPPHFRSVKAQEVKDGVLTPCQFEFKDSNISLNLPSVDTARAFVITRER